MKTTRTYLAVPGQRIEIRIEGDTAVGKSRLAEKIVAMAQADGLLAHHHDCTGYNEISVTCPSDREARALYLLTLDQQQAETLRGHLDALGYEL